MVDISKIYNEGLLFDGHYKLIRPLSTAGGSADVWLAIDTNTVDNPDEEDKATKVAIKIYRPKNFIDVEGEYQFRKEFKKVFGCHHENIITPTYFSIYEESAYLVLPFCPLGSSEKLIGQAIDEDELWKYVYQVASGLAYLHEHKPQIVHQDIKPANVLIDDNGNYTITDFGISAEMGGADTDCEDETGGTFAYMAPERFSEGTPPMAESDIWAFGATLFEIITGDAPFGNNGGQDQKENETLPIIKKKIPREIQKIINKSLCFDYSKRPTARSIAEVARRKGKKSYIGVLVTVLLTVVIAVASILLLKQPKPIEPFAVYYHQGDSVLNIQKQECNTGQLLVFDVVFNRLSEAKSCYVQALSEQTENVAKRDSIMKCLISMEDIFSDLGTYKGVSDTLNIVEMDEVPIQINLYGQKKKELSDNIKNKILDL